MKMIISNTHRYISPRLSGVSELFSDFGGGFCRRRNQKKRVAIAGISSKKRDHQMTVS